MRLLRMSRVALILLMAGCGSETHSFDKSVEYTPEALAQELALRTRDLKSLPSDTPPKTGLKNDQEIQKKSKAATKEAPQSTIEGIVEDIVDKAGTIPGTKRADVLKAIIEKISADKTVPEPQRGQIVIKLNAMADQ